MRDRLLRQFGANVRNRRLRRALSQEALATRSRSHRNYIGDVVADFKNRIGEVIGRRNTRFIAVLLTCERRDLAEELDRATDQTRGISAAMGFAGSVLLFGDISGRGWALSRALDIGLNSP